MTLPTNRDSEAFVDPLENYDPKKYDDPLEEAICETPASAIQHTPYTTITPDTPAAEAVKLLADNHIACLLVAEEGELLGIFTHREVLNKLALEPSDLQRPVRELMTPNPICVNDDAPVAATLCVMAVHGYRHVPLLDAEGKLSGIVSPQRVTRFLSNPPKQSA